MLRFWNRLMKMNNSRLTKQIFEWDLMNHHNNNWSSNVMNIAVEIGMGETILKGELFGLQRVKELLMHNDWSNKIGDMPK